MINNLYHLELTGALAKSGFNALVLAEMERDALNLALIKLQGFDPKEAIDSSKLIIEANRMLPRPNSPEAMNIFFATKHQIEDQPFDTAKDLGEFISNRASAIEAQASKSLNDSNSAPQWVEALAQLAVSYSFVIEAATELAKNGHIALRRVDELEALTQRPDDEKDVAKANLFDKANAFLEQRQEDEKLQLKEQYR